MKPNPPTPGDEIGVCPSCRGDLFSWIGNEAGDLEWPHCSGCGMQGPVGANRAEAIRLWNALPRTPNPLISVLAEAVHDRLFGVASLGDASLAMREIGDGGGIHEAVHELLRSLPHALRTRDEAARSATSEEVERMRATFRLIAGRNGAWAKEARAALGEEA